MGNAKNMAGSDLTSEVKVKDQLLASCITCSGQNKNDIPEVNVRSEIRGSLRFDLRGQGRGLYQRRTQQ